MYNWFFVNIIKIIMKVYSSLITLFGMFTTTSRDSRSFSQTCSMDYTDCFINKPIITSTDLVFSAERNIVVASGATIKALGSANILFEAGTGGNGDGSVIFKGRGPQVILDNGTLRIYYNPRTSSKHKYTNPEFYGKHANVPPQVESYMWVNDIYDLQNMRVSLNSRYALSRDIESEESIERINAGKGFQPLQIPDDRHFGGVFDGRNHSIKNLKIKCIKNPDISILFSGCGIFGLIDEAEIKNLRINNCSVEGSRSVGVLFGVAFNSNITNVHISNSSIKGKSVVGRLGGNAEDNTSLSNIYYDDSTTIESEEYQGELVVY